MNAREIINTRLSDEELNETIEYFAKQVGGTIKSAYYPALRDFVRAREREVFGSPKFESAMYANDNGQTERDPLDEGE